MTSPEGELSSRIVGAVKAELARRDLTGADLVKPLGLGKNAVYARLRGDQPFDTIQLAQIVLFLGISFEELWASADIGKTGVAA